MFMSLKKIQALFVFLLFASLVYAQDYSLHAGKFHEPAEEGKIEFEFYNGTYGICENEKKFVPILVANEEPSGDSYSLDVSGASWAKLNAVQFSLQGKQSGAVFLELNPASNTNGRYVIGVNSLSSSGNVRKSLNLDVLVEKCHSLRLEIQDEDKVCGGAKRQYMGEIINDGKLGSGISLEISAPNWVSLDKDTFSIAAGQKENFILGAEIPSNAKGLFNVLLSAGIEDFPVKSEKRLGIEVTPKYECYRADIISSQKIENDYSNEFAPVRIKNNGIRQANYDLSVEGPGWVSIEPEKLLVNPGQTANINLNINPGNDIAEDTYPVKINVKFEDIVYAKTVNVELAKNKFLKSLKSFFVFYQYYIYLMLAALLLLLIFRRQIEDKAKNSYKNYRARQSRLKALKAARSARELKKKLRQLGKPGAKARAKKHDFRKLFLFFAGFIIVASILSFSVYKFDFPASKETVKDYYAYIIGGILIAFFAIFIIEFYRPLFKSLRKIK